MWPPQVKLNILYGSAKGQREELISQSQARILFEHAYRYKEGAQGTVGFVKKAHAQTLGIPTETDVIVKKIESITWNGEIINGTYEYRLHSKLYSTLSERFPFALMYFCKPFEMDVDSYLEDAKQAKIKKHEDNMKKFGRSMKMHLMRDLDFYAIQAFACDSGETLMLFDVWLHGDITEDGYREKEMSNEEFMKSITNTDTLHEVATQLGIAVGVMHACGIIHTDLLTPGNVILCWKGGTVDRIVIVDFGMALETEHAEISKKAKDVEDIQMYSHDLGDFFNHFIKKYNQYAPTSTKPS